MSGSTSTDRQAEIDGYAAAVRAALADLPAEDVGELLEDLEDHLAEVAADGDSPLASRLGPPATYARELRVAAGLPAAGTADGGGRLGLARRLERLRSSRPVVEVVRFLPELRPAWWVVRAWAAVTAVDLVFVGGTSFPLPTLGLGLVGVVATGAAIVWSVWLGLRSRAADRRPGRTAAVLNGALAVLTLVALVGVARGPSVASAEPVYYDSGPPANGLVHEDGSPITNIYPYSSEGEPLTGVRLYDQDGRPIDDLADRTADGGEVEPAPDAAPQLGNVFPQQRQVVTYDELGERVVVPMDVPAAPSVTSAPSTSAPATSGSATATPSAGAPTTTAGD